MKLLKATDHKICPHLSITTVDIRRSRQPTNWIYLRKPIRFLRFLYIYCSCDCYVICFYCSVYVVYMFGHSPDSVLILVSLVNSFSFLYLKFLTNNADEQSVLPFGSAITCGGMFLNSYFDFQCTRHAHLMFLYSKMLRQNKTTNLKVACA